MTTNKIDWPNFFLALALLCFAPTACSRDNPPKEPTSSPEARVRDKAALYLELAPEAQDADGFAYGKCDSLLFTALSASIGMQVDITRARGAGGQWFRHARHDCYDLKQSESDISGDMLLGLAWWAWQKGQRDVVVGVIDYGKANNWTMGRGDPFRTVMRPGLIMTYYDIARELGASPGDPPPAVVAEAATSADLLQLPLPVGYEADLQVLHTLLRAHVLGGASDTDVEIFRRQADRQPRNAFFQAAYHLYTDGDQKDAYAVLDNNLLFPLGSLPTREDRCEMWLWHRDEGADWEGCAASPEDPRPHAGFDLMFALAVADNSLRKRGP